MKILAIEDEQVINDYMCALLSDDYDVTSCYDASSGVAKIRETRFDLVLCDIMLGSESGFSVLEYIDQNELRIPVIMLTALDDEESLTCAYDLGVIDYIVKPVNKQILKMKIKNFQMHIMQEVNDVEIDEKLQIAKVNGQDIYLTKIEYQILSLLLNEPSRVFTKDNLIDRIWSGNQSMSNRIVDTNIFNLRKKLGCKSHVIKTKRGVGYYYENKE